MKVFVSLLFCFAMVVVSGVVQAAGSSVKLKDLGRFDGWRENYITGIGLITGLAGTGDSPRSKATRQALANLMARYDLNVSESAIASRNVAAVVVTASLPAFARSGDRIDVAVSSIGDAKSLAGGSLLMTPLKGPNDQIYCLAQGALTVSGYKFEANDTYEQNNHPTAGIVSAGCTVETAVLANTLSRDRKSVRYLLNNPDYALAAMIAKAIKASISGVDVSARDAGTIDIRLSDSVTDDGLVALLSALEAVAVEPEQRARVVVNERSGLIVAGADVSISPVMITQGNLRITVTTSSVISQPLVIGRASGSVGAVVVPESAVSVSPVNENAVVVRSGTNVNDLVEELARQKVGVRQIVSVLQALRTAGALYADIIVQ